MGAFHIICLNVGTFDENIFLNHFLKYEAKSNVRSVFFVSVQRPWSSVINSEEEKSFCSHWHSHLNLGASGYVHTVLDSETEHCRKLEYQIGHLFTLGMLLSKQFLLCNNTAPPTVESGMFHIG